MPSTSETLLRVVDLLHRERAAHAKAVYLIDEIFKTLGITKFPAAGKRRGRPKESVNKPKAGKIKQMPWGTYQRARGIAQQRKRKSYPETASAFVLSLLGKKGLPASEVNATWKMIGRPGTANNTLTALVKSGKLKRSGVAGQRGGIYTRV